MKWTSELIRLDKSNFLTSKNKGGKSLCQDLQDQHGKFQDV